jgi:hypothetical protein
VHSLPRKQSAIADRAERVHPGGASCSWGRDQATFAWDSSRLTRSAGAGAPPDKRGQPV